MAALIDPPAAGSVRWVVDRLLVWGRRAPSGLARVLFYSADARKDAAARLETSLGEIDVPVQEIDIRDWMELAPEQLAAVLVRRLRETGTGLVSIHGWEWVLNNEGSAKAAIRAINARREDLAVPGVRQAWWLSPDMLDCFESIAPDLASWFLLRLELTASLDGERAELRERADGSVVTEPQILTEGPVQNGLRDRRRDPSEARAMAADFAGRARKAAANGASVEAIRGELALPAVHALREASLEDEAAALDQELTGVLASVTPVDVGSPRKIDFFISYNHRDQQWAEWIAAVLEAAGYVTVIQAWDFHPGGNFVLEMQKAASESERTVAVLSPNYLVSEFCAPEWAATFSRDPTGEKGLLVPVRVRPCDITGLLAPIAYIDLVDISAEVAKTRLLDGVKRGRAKPAGRIPFPDEGTHKGTDSRRLPEFPAKETDLWQVPFPPNRFFVGRDDLIENIGAALAEQKPNPIAVLTGLGGIGKSQIAREYVRRRGGKYRAVLWLDASSETSSLTGLLSAAQDLHLVEADQIDARRITSTIGRWLGSRDDWLVVLDNLRDPVLPRAFLPPEWEGHVVVTSRLGNLQEIGVLTPISVGPFSMEEAVGFLSLRTRLQSQTDRNDAAALADTLGGLPLALEQAAAYLSSKPCEIGDYLKAYRQRGLKLLETAKPATAYPASVATTWVLNFEEVSRTSEASVDLLRLAAFLAPDGIPATRLLPGAEELTPALRERLRATREDPLVIGELLAPLTRYSLVRALSSDRFDVHPLVQEVTRSVLSKSDHRLWVERAVGAMSKCLPAPEFNRWQECSQLAAHAEACVRFAQDEGLQGMALVLLLNNLAGYLREQGRLIDGERLYQKAIRAAADLPPLEQASVMEGLGDLYILQGRYGDALHLYERCRKVVDAHRGPLHPEAATVLLSMGNAHSYMGEFKRADLEYDDALRIFRRRGGPPGLLAQCLVGLSKTRRSHDPEGALKLIEEARDLIEHHQGQKHPDLAAALNWRGSMLMELGRYDDAMADYTRALEINSAARGAAHEVSLTIRHNMAECYRLQGNLAGAEKLLREVISDTENDAGSPGNLAGSVQSLGVVLRAEGKQKEAELEFRRALDMLDSMEVQPLPELYAVLWNYGSLLAEVGRQDAAAPILARAVIVKGRLGK